MKLPKDLENYISEKIGRQRLRITIGDGQDKETLWACEEEKMQALFEEVYTTARRQALTEGIASLPPKEDENCPENCMGDYEHGKALGANAYRAEAIAKLTQLRDV